MTTFRMNGQVFSAGIVHHVDSVHGEIRTGHRYERWFTFSYTTYKIRTKAGSKNDGSQNMSDPLATPSPTSKNR